MKVLLAAGGTGGHIFPALALAEEVRNAGGEACLLGAAGGMEERLAAEAQVPFIGVPAGKWDRQRPDPRQALRALSGLVAAIRATRAFAPHVIVGFGGFASFPGCVAARWTGTPLVLHEGNVQPGRVTRWFARSAALVATAFPETEARLPQAKHVTTVGFPVREAKPDRQAARAGFGLPQDAVVTMVMGGSQGSLALNTVTPQAYRALPTQERGFVLHASGRRWADEVTVATADLANYHVHGFLDAPAAWAAADLAITRGGISTLSEAALHGVPVIAIPLPTSADDHQRANARAIAESGGGFAVEQDDLEDLTQAWRTLLTPDARSQAAVAISARSPEGAARRLFDLVQQVTRGGSDTIQGEETSA